MQLNIGEQYTATITAAGSTTVTITITAPTGGTSRTATWTTTTPDPSGVITPVAADTWAATWVCDAPGEWRYRFAGTGGVQPVVDVAAIWLTADSYGLGGPAPTIRDVARILAQRTFVGGEKLDTFTAQTNPTAVQAQDAIVTASILVRAAVGAVPADKTGADWDAVRSLIGTVTAYKAALILCTTDDPEYERISSEYDRMLPEARKALQDATAGDQLGFSDDQATRLPAWSFPAASTTLTETY